MRFAELAKTFEGLGFPRDGVRVHPSRELVLEARGAVTLALQDDEFLLDCIEQELDLLETGTFRDGLCPFFEHPALGIQFAFGYWAPDDTPGPHEHTAWNITSVCWNRLDVQVFDYSESLRLGRLVPKRRFEATKGNVGYLYEPCLHEPINPTSEWSLSLHISSPLDEPVQAQDLPWRSAKWAAVKSGHKDVLSRAHPFRQVLTARQRQLLVDQLLPLIAATKGARATDAFERAFDLASPAGRRENRSRLTIPRERSVYFCRVHKDLGLRFREESHRVVLEVETGTERTVRVPFGRHAAMAVKFIQDATSFAATDLPGLGSEVEQMDVAHALEAAGLFRRG